MKQNLYFESLQNAWLREMQVFSPHLLASGWIGSLAHGGFSEKYSDIDLVLIFDPLPEVEWFESRIKPILKNLPEADRWSIFWSDLSLSGGRMPIPDKIDLFSHVKWFAGKAQIQAEKPNLSELRKYLKEHSLPYWRDLLKSDSNIGQQKRLLRLALYPARFAYSWDTGKIDSNEKAVEYVLDSAWPIDASLLKAALKMRLSGNFEPELTIDRISKQMREVFSKV